MDWRSAALSDGYPRFGIGETITAGVIDASATDTITMVEVVLKEAVTLAVGAAATLLLAF